MSFANRVVEADAPNLDFAHLTDQKEQQRRELDKSNALNQMFMSPGEGQGVHVQPKDPNATLQELHERGIALSSRLDFPTDVIENFFED
jgi:hypothetical protein